MRPTDLKETGRNLGKEKYWRDFKYDIRDLGIVKLYKTCISKFYHERGYIEFCF